MINGRLVEAAVLRSWRPFARTEPLSVSPSLTLGPSAPGADLIEMLVSLYRHR
jgi:hypothetical protein